MYLIEDNRFGVKYLVFTWENPKRSGYKGQVIDGITLDYDWSAVHSWPEGSRAPDASVGRDPNEEKHFKVFKYSEELLAAGYQPVDGTAVVFGSWDDYAKLHLIPPDREQVDDEQWFAYLDRLDEETRRNRRRNGGPSVPMAKGRDEVADWVAKKHLLADSGIREVWYLPRGAPAEEIRLLELNDRFGRDAEQAEAIDFGLDIEGVKFRLLVADVSSDQLAKIKQDPSRLPAGWSLEGNRILRRGA